MDFYPFNHKHCVLTDGNRAVLACHFDDSADMHHYCGYVAIPIGSVPVEWRGNYNADALQYLAIHGGITYCEVAPKEEPQFVVFGFDCAHCDDDENPDLKDVSYVMRLAAQMESQLITYAKRIEKWRDANRERRIEIIESIIREAEVKTELGFGALVGMLGGASEFGVGEESGAVENKEAGTQPTTPAGVPETQLSKE
jgi:hypothetical protein